MVCGHFTRNQVVFFLLTFCLSPCFFGYGFTHLPEIQSHGSPKYAGVCWLIGADMFCCFFTHSVRLAFCSVQSHVFVVLFVLLDRILYDFPPHACMGSVPCCCVFGLLCRPVFTIPGLLMPTCCLILGVLLLLLICSLLASGVFSYTCPLFCLCPVMHVCQVLGAPVGMLQRAAPLLYVHAFYSVILLTVCCCFLMLCALVQLHMFYNCDSFPLCRVFCPLCAYSMLTATC